MHKIRGKRREKIKIKKEKESWREVGTWRFDRVPADAPYPSRLAPLAPMVCIKVFKHE